MRHCSSGQARAHSVSDTIPATALSLPLPALPAGAAYCRQEGFKTWHPGGQLLQELQWWGEKHPQSEIRIKYTTGSSDECVWWSTHVRDREGGDWHPPPFQFTLPLSSPNYIVVISSTHFVLSSNLHLWPYKYQYKIKTKDLSNIHYNLFNKWDIYVYKHNLIHSPGRMDLELVGPHQ